MRKLTLSVSSAIATLLTTPVVFMTPTNGYAQALEEITVTARKTTESLQEVPLAITALSGDDIERLNLQDLADISQQDTSVQFDEGFTPSDTRITIRGLSPTRGRPNAATLVDGIDLTSEAVSNAGGSTLINPRLVDIQRIEIVKGPQSALYGRSAFAGAVQYITKDPADTLSGDIFVNANDGTEAELRGSLSVPISDTIGMLVNGYAFDSRGFFRNTATDDYVGGGNGGGASVTFKFEPTDNLGLKWRTEYSRDKFDVAPQALLNDRNTLLDLNTVTPGASTCNLTPDADGNLLSGPLDDGSCALKFTTRRQADGSYAPEQFDNETFILNNFFTNNPAELGQYDPTDPQQVNQYNKQVISFYQGELPKGRGLRPTLNPNYREEFSFDPATGQYSKPSDYDGTDREVFRTSLKIDWAITDNLEFLSNSSYLDSTVKIQTDIGKYYVDECSADIDSLFVPYADPTQYPGGFASYGEFLTASTASGGRGLTREQTAKFAPCTLAGGDGINDASNQFIQDDDTATQQISQEFRLAWQSTESLNLVGGVQFWQEKVDLKDINSTTVGGGPECFIQGRTTDSSQGPGANFLQVSNLQDQCGNTSIIAAYYMNDTFQGRLEQPSNTLRQTDHYSIYGSLDWDLTEKLTFRVEGRYVIEDNLVEGVTQVPCLNGELPQSWYDGQGLTPPADADPCNNINQPFDKLEVANGGQATGPSAVLLCGSVGRCDRLGYANTPYDSTASIFGGAEIRSNGSPWYAGNNPGSSELFGNFTGDSWWAFGLNPTPGVRTELNRTDRFWAPKATAEYFWNDAVMTYFSWSRGIKPGGFSLLTSGAFGLDANLDGIYDEIEFEPERLDVWELGYKTTLFEGRVRLNGSFYYQDFKDKQVTVQKVTAGTTGTEVANISGSQVLGTEVDLTIQITDNLRSQIGYTFLDTEYTDYTIITQSGGDIARINAGNPDQDCSELAIIPSADGGPVTTATAPVGCVMSFNGNELERAPKHAWLVNLSYTNSLFDTGLEWYTEANYRYQDKRFMEAFNIVQFQSYSLTDLRFGLLAEKWDVQFYVNNVFDNDTIITGGPNPGIPTGSFGFGLAAPPPVGLGVNAGPKLPSDIYVNLPNPRVIGLNAKYRFGG